MPKAGVDHILSGNGCHNYRIEEAKVGTQVVGKRWIVDVSAYGECDKCGINKSLAVLRKGYP